MWVNYQTVFIIMVDNDEYTEVLQRTHSISNILTHLKQAPI